MERGRAPHIYRGTSVPHVAISLVAIALACGVPLAAQVANSSGIVEFALCADELSGLEFRSVSLMVFATICEIALQLQGALTGSVFSDLRLGASGSVGDLGLNTTIVLDPSAASVVNWQAGAAITVADVDLGAILSAEPTPATSNLLITVEGGNDCATFGCRVRLGVCPTELWEVALDANWGEVLCGRPAKTALSFTCAGGFESFDIVLGDIALIEASTMGIEGYLDFAVSFTPDSKRASPTLRLETDWTVCPQLGLLGEIMWSSFPFRIDGLSVFGLQLDVGFAERVGLVVAESFVESKNAVVTGKADYFEMIGVYGPLPSCCGRPGAFEIMSYFRRSPAVPSALLGWGLLEASGELWLSDALSIAVDVRYAAVSPLWEIVVRVQVQW